MWAILRHRRRRRRRQPFLERQDMKVSDILRLKGSTLYVAQADDALADAVPVMA